MQAIHVIMQALQAVSSTDWSMVTAITAVVGLGGTVLNWSIKNSVREQLHEQDERMEKKFASTDTVIAHDRRIELIENHFLSPRTRSHGD